MISFTIANGPTMDFIVFNTDASRKSLQLTLREEIPNRLHGFITLRGNFDLWKLKIPFKPQFDR